MSSTSWPSFEKTQSSGTTHRSWGKGLTSLFSTQCTWQASGHDQVVRQKLSFRACLRADRLADIMCVSRTGRAKMSGLDTDHC